MDIKKTAKELLMASKNSLRIFISKNIYPQKPTTLNFMANDICNSKCQMCLIWKNKPDTEIQPDDLQNILSDPLFSKLRYVGVSGGEPTLRKDLPDIFRVLCQKHPKLKGLGVITNGIIEDLVKKQVLECADICQEHSIPFNVMVSIDGLGDTHDLVRGRPGNFQTSISLLKLFQQQPHIDVSFGCTITKSNVFHVDELLDFAIKENLYGRFRIAEFIERLYNSDVKDFIRCFTPLESYHLGLLFHRLENEFESNRTYKKTYKNIRKMIAEGTDRSIGCPYQSDSIVLTSRGDLLYCSPKSPILGSAISTPATHLYYSNIKVRKNIGENDCNSCIHDYHEPLQLEEYIRNRVKYWVEKKFYGIDNLIQQSRRLTPKTKISMAEVDCLDSQKVLIIGWYGTETAGDKAILWSVIKNLRQRSSPPREILVASLFPFVSNWTLKELRINNVSIVETYSQGFRNAVNTADEIVVGGGPLMDIEVLNHILFAFIRATKKGIVKRIYGCGIGPLHEEKYLKVVSEIIKLSDSVTLRDKKSVAFCSATFRYEDIEVTKDPATDFVNFYMSHSDDFPRLPLPFESQKYLVCLLRKWSSEYSYGLQVCEFLEQEVKFNENLIDLIQFIALRKGLHINLLPMHAFHVGGDDRVFNRKIASGLVQKSDILSGEKNGLSYEVDCVVKPMAPSDILRNMMNSEIAICMRFHSVVFAENLGIPYIAIDYTRGGKITAFLEDVGKTERMLTMAEMISGSWEAKIEAILGL